MEDEAYQDIIDGLNGEINGLYEQIDEYNNSLENCEVENQEWATTVSDQREEIEGLQAVIDGCHDSIKDLHETNSQLENELDDLYSEINELKEARKRPVGVPDAWHDSNGS